MLKSIRAQFSGKFGGDVLWNLVAFGAAGVCALLLNVLVAVLYDAAVLGVYNQVFAAYIFFSQFAVGGVHYSVLRSMAEHEEADRPVKAGIVWGALVPALGLATLSVVVFVLSRHAIAGLLQSPDVAVGMLWAAPGLLLFSLNKVLMGAVNGLSRMRAFAVLQGLRPLSMMTAVFVVLYRGTDAAVLPVALTASEVVVFLGAIPILRRELFAWPAELLTWAGRHLAFGIRSFASGVLVELNTRVDVLMLGYFVSDEIVGYYSLAAILTEGCYQLLVVLRNNFNPILVKLIAIGDLDGLRQQVARGRKVTYGIMLAIGLVAVLAFPIGPKWIGGAEYMQSWPLFATLMAGIVISSGYVPFNNLLLQAGRPGTHTLMTATIVLFNVVANYLFIPIWGGFGAALATGLSFVYSVVALRLFTKLTMGLRI